MEVCLEVKVDSGRGFGKTARERFLQWRPLGALRAELRFEGLDLVVDASEAILYFSLNWEIFLRNSEVVWEVSFWRFLSDFGNFDSSFIDLLDRMFMFKVWK